MQILFIALFSVISVFAIIFIVGFITAAIRNSGKRLPKQAINEIARIPDELRVSMREMILAYKKHDIAGVNTIVTSAGSDQLRTMLELTKPENRPPTLSSGKLMDNVAFSVMETELIERGYKESAAKIVTGIVLNCLDDTLVDKKLSEQIAKERTRLASMTDDEMAEEIVKSLPTIKNENAGSQWRRISERQKQVMEAKKQRPGYPTSNRTLEK